VAKTDNYGNIVIVSGSVHKSEDFFKPSHVVVRTDQYGNGIILQGQTHTIENYNDVTSTPSPSLELPVTAQATQNQLQI
jgi:hypothetical protein